MFNLRLRILAAAVAAAVVAALVTWIALSASSFGDDFWTSTVGSDGVKVFVLRGNRIIRVFSLWFLFVFCNRSSGGRNVNLHIKRGSPVNGRVLLYRKDSFR